MTRTVSSTPILRAVLLWGGVVGALVLVVAAIAGAIVAGASGLWSGIVGALVGIVFPALTAVSILVANRWFGTPRYIEIFFGIVLGGWLVKFVLVIVAFLVLAQAPWIEPLVFYIALLAAAVAALVVDLVVFARMRLPAVSDIEMPEDQAGPDQSGSGNRPAV